MIKPGTIILRSGRRTRIRAVPDGVYSELSDRKACLASWSRAPSLVETSVAASVLMSVSDFRSRTP